MQDFPFIAALFNGFDLTYSKAEEPAPAGPIFGGSAKIYAACAPSLTDLGTNETQTTVSLKLTRNLRPVLYRSVLQVRSKL